MVSFININISKYVYIVYTFRKKNPVKSRVSANIKTRFRTLKTRFRTLKNTFPYLEKSNKQI